MEGVIGVVTCFAADFAPKYWATCDGQILPIAQNQALFSILGTAFGGNGTTTFALPDLRGRTAISAGQLSGGSFYQVGQPVGNETTTMTQNNMPIHTHSGAFASKLTADADAGSQVEAEFGFPAQYGSAYATTANATMAPAAYAVTIGLTGGNLPIPTRSPYLVINYIICLQGIFPSRN